MAIFTQTVTAQQILDALTTDSTKWAGADIPKPKNLITELRFYSQPDDLVIGASTGTKSLPSVTLPNLAGLTILYVFAGFKYAGLYNTYADHNRTDVTGQYLQVKESVSGSWTSGIEFELNSFPMNGNDSVPAGAEYIGNIDIKGEVSAFNKTYLFQWYSASMVGDNMNFYGVQTFLVIGVKVS